MLGHSEFSHQRVTDEFVQQPLLSKHRRSDRLEIAVQQRNNASAPITLLRAVKPTRSVNSTAQWVLRPPSCVHISWPDSSMSCIKVGEIRLDMTDFKNGAARFQRGTAQGYGSHCPRVCKQERRAWPPPQAPGRHRLPPQAGSKADCAER